MRMKYFAIVGIVGALATAGGAPAFAQDYGYGYRHASPHYGYYPSAEGGECYVVTDPTLGFGYWGSCATRGAAIGRSTGDRKTQNLPYSPLSPR